jgi:hypothetical protein
MATMASCFSITSQIWDTFLASKVAINYEKLNKVKINNLKAVRKLSVITKEELDKGLKLFGTYN